MVCSDFFFVLLVKKAHIPEMISMFVGLRLASGSDCSERSNASEGRGKPTERTIYKTLVTTVVSH